MGAFVERVHFVGIGGVGMSGIAEVLHNLGYKVSGSDLMDTEITRRLKGLGVAVHLGHAARLVKDCQVVVVSSAVAPDNPEVAAARAAGIPVVQRALMLAELGRMKQTVTVAGSHGKTTTTSMVAMALKSAGADPTMVVGGQLKDIRSNARLGVGEYLVAEADESDGSFLHLSPLAAVVTNVDDDHLDYYGTLERLRSAFLEHLRRLPFYGAAILCADDPALKAIAGALDLRGCPSPGRVITYGASRAAEWRAACIELSSAGSSFVVLHRGKAMGTIRLKVPGRHNVLNALGALAAGMFLGFPFKALARGLSEFGGVGRRLDVLGEASGVHFVDDYGHHPTEVAATLEALRLWKGRRVVVFQPHRYSRTKLLAERFGPAFRAADFVYVMDVYAAGEKPVPGVTSKLILDSLRRSRVKCAPFLSALAVARELAPGDVVLTLGAGDVWKIGEDLLRRSRTQFTSPV
ncbi:MAG: UDP-N-acetylmuramate--L-alanine ligase [Elusimicrobia bacterium]|nr:UDP-N-acetylmuramate--L-alanine ligase [Elusimicrobiota bacterium]